MKIDVFASHTHLDEKTLRGKTVIILDPLRSTSTIVTALANGCEQIIPVKDVDQAISLQESMKESEVVLGGERNDRKVPGFDLGNSPFEYTTQNISGKTLIFTTTNGTTAIGKAKDASAVYIGAMINSLTAANALLRAESDTVLLLAGKVGRFSLDDALTAGYIISCIVKFGFNIRIELDDLGFVCLKLYEQYKDDLIGALKYCSHAIKLFELGSEKDIEYCLNRDTVSILPIYKDGRITV